LHGTNDYKRLVEELHAKANEGDVEAQYYSAAALRYCQEHLSRFLLRPQGGAFTLDEAQSKWANRQESYRSEIEIVYLRCRAYLESYVETGAWVDWLDMAVAARYPKAQSMRANDLRVKRLIAERSEIDSPHDDHQASMAQARELAIESIRTGEPEPIFAMGSWVDKGVRSPGEYAVLMSAWQLFACQRGFDCGPESEWLRSACHYDVECIPGQTVEAYLRRHLGVQFEKAEETANEIGRAVDAHNWDALNDYL